MISRSDKVNEFIKREIGKMLMMGEIKDPRINMVTIQKVEVSKDLQHARVYFSILSDDPKDIESAEEGLESCRGYMRKLVGERIEMRYVPELRFYYDKGIQHAAHIDEALEKIKQLPKAKGGS